MEYYRNILINKSLDDNNIEILLKNRMSRFYLGYLSITLKNNNSNKLLHDNLEILKKYL